MDQLIINHWLISLGFKRNKEKEENSWINRIKIECGMNLDGKHQA